MGITKSLRSPSSLLMSKRRALDVRKALAPTAPETSNVKPNQPVRPNREKELAGKSVTVAANKEMPKNVAKNMPAAARNEKCGSNSRSSISIRRAWLFWLYTAA
jgi:hypothetical protein